MMKLDNHCIEPLLFLTGELRVVLVKKKGQFFFVLTEVKAANRRYLLNRA